MSSKYKRDTDSKRREQNNKILIVCCGETEKNYFEKFKLDLGTIRIHTVLKPISPLQIVQEALNKKSAYQYRQVWCIFDKDENDDFNDAIELATNSGIEYAFSNQAFEIWFILHFERKDGSLHRKEYNRVLKSHLGTDYDKPADKIYNKLKTKTPIAIINAKYGHQTHAKKGGTPSTWESCTTVYKLVEELLRWRK